MAATGAGAGSAGVSRFIGSACTLSSTSGLSEVDPEDGTTRNEDVGEVSVEVEDPDSRDEPICGVWWTVRVLAEVSTSPSYVGESTPSSDTTPDRWGLCRMRDALERLAITTLRDCASGEVGVCWLREVDAKITEAESSVIGSLSSSDLRVERR